MYSLTFQEDLCERCLTGDCLVKCQFIDIDVPRAQAEMLTIAKGGDSTVLHDCVTCYACEEYCPVGNHPFYMITERREEKGILTAPRAITRQWVNIGMPRGKYELGEIGSTVLSFGFMPQFLSMVQGRLFEDVMPSYVFGQEFFCNVVYVHFATTSIIKERLPAVIDQFQNLGVKEVVFIHDECYAAFVSSTPAFGIDVPFHSVHYYEYLYRRLGELREEIRPLHVKVAYQRPCSSRLCPETHEFVRKIMDLIGVELVPRTYQDENALCCGSIFRMMYGYDLATDVQRRNLEDMAAHGAEYCVFNCPGCQSALETAVAGRGIVPIHMIDLCRSAIGEEPDAEVKGDD